MAAFDVFNISGDLIDTVFFDNDCSAEYVKRSLIDHDGFNHDIEVVNTSFDYDQYFICSIDESPEYYGTPQNAVMSVISLKGGCEPSHCEDMLRGFPSWFNGHFSDYDTYNLIGDIDPDEYWENLGIAMANYCNNLLTSN